MFIDYDNHDNVIIKHKDIIYHGYITRECDYFLQMQETTNDIPFIILEIKDKYTFVENIVGYSISHTANFPHVRSRRDLIEVLDALNKEYNKRFGTCLKSSDFFVGEKVLVRNDLKIDKNYGIITALKSHILLSNRVATICKIDYDDGTLKIEEDTCDLWWSPEMFTKIVTLPKNVSFKAEELKDSTISINNFIKSKKHYQLNFNY